MKETLDFLNNLLKKNDSVVVGISGGPDSMCLLYALISLKEKLNLKIICAHVNHNLRKESEVEAEYLKKYCEENNIIFEYLVIDEYKNNKFTESEGRKKRYNFFDKLIKKYNANYLMTAHHGNDLEETILMRIVRGSNLKGYIGISRISDNGKYKIVRPLLNLNKNMILEYLEQNNIKYFIDKSNEDEKYTRNRYRKHMLPLLRKEDKMVHLKFLKYSEELESYNNYVNRVIDKKISNIYIDNAIIIEKLKKEDIFIQRKIIEKVIEIIQKEEIFNINDIQLKNIFDLLNGKENKKINLSDGFVARKSYNKLYIEKSNIIDDYCFIFSKSIKLFDKYKIERINNSDDKSNNVTRIYSKELKLPLIVRNIKKGDKLKVKNLNGTKKVKDIFIDLKIDKEKRREYPLVVDSENNIIWIPGLKKSIFDKEISEKCDIILKYTEEKNE